MDWIVTVIVAIGGLVASIGSGLGVWLKMRHTQKMESDTTAIGQFGILADRLEKQNARWEADAAAKQKLIDHLAERDTLCQIRLSRYWAWMAQASDRINILTGMLREAGKDPGIKPLPELKAPPEFDDAAGFAARTSAQVTSMISAANPIPGSVQLPPGSKP